MLGRQCIETIRKRVTNNDFINEAKKLNVKEDRVDEFYSKILDPPSPP